ncbi:hypothetical protein ACROYT_G028412 [Oculina patagonica]
MSLYLIELLIVIPAGCLLSGLLMRDYFMEHTQHKVTFVRCDREVEILHAVYLSIIILLVIIIVIISVISWRRRQIPGGSPYPGVNARQIVPKLQEGFRMPKPKHVDSKL